MNKICSYLLTLCLISSGLAMAQKAVITGTIHAQGEKLEFLSLEKFYFNEQRRQIIQRLENKQPDVARHPFLAEVELESPMVLQLFFKNMYFSPGDTVHVDYYYNRNGDSFTDSIAVRAKYPYDLLFYEQLAKHKYGFLPNPSDTKYTARWDTYKSDLEAFYKNVLSGIKESEHLFSPRFLNHVKEDLFYDKLERLGIPVELGLVARDNLPHNYFEAFDSMDLNNDNLLQLNNYCSSLFSYNTIVKYKGNRNKLDIAQYLQLMQGVDSMHTGEVKSYLSFHISNWFFKKAQPEVIREMKQPLDTYILAKVNDKYKAIILENYPFQYAVSKKTMSKELMNMALRDFSGKPTSLGQVIAANKGKLIYVDLWASWCAPCLTDIPKARAMVADSFSQQIVDIYIAIDADDKKWKGESNKLGIPKENAFVVSSEEVWNLMSTALNIESIPHGFLLSENIFLNFDMPRPSSHDLFLDELKNQINIDKQKKAQQGSAPPPPPMLREQ